MTPSQFFKPRLGCVALVLGMLVTSSAWSQVGPSARLKRIEADKVLRVCIWPEYYGISYRNPKTQKLQGVDVDNAHEVAKALGAKVEFVNSSFATLVQDVEADKCDLAMFAIGVTPERAQKLSFSQPHLKSDVFGITTRSNRAIKSWSDIDQPGVVVVVTQGTLHEPVMKANLKRAELRVVNSPLAREAEVQSGRADVFMTDFPYSRRVLDNNEWARLVAPPTTFHITPYAWAMRKGDDAFVARVDAVLSEMKKDGRLLAHAKAYGLESIVATATP